MVETTQVKAESQEPENLAAAPAAQCACSRDSQDVQDSAVGTASTASTASTAGAGATAAADAAAGAAGAAGAKSSEHDAQNPAHFIELKGGYRRLVMLAGAASVTTAVILIAMKFVVWLYSGSATILASLTDSMIDLGASCINLLALRYALMPPDKDHRFGHYKAEALASLSQAAFISGSAMLLMINGYDRIVKPQVVEYVDIAIYVSIASIVLTILLTLFQGYVCKVTHSEAIAADRFHYISDVGLNLTVILSLVLSKMGYAWADGLMAMLLGLYILKSSWHIGHTAINTLLDKSMSQSENNKIIQTILSVEGVESFHDLRTRKAGPQNYIQCHLVLDATMTLERAHNIADEVENQLSKLFSDVDINLHMEPNDARTYTDITFYDHLSCPVPENFYIRKAEEKKSLEDIAASRAAEAAKAAEIAAQAARAAAEAANQIAHIVKTQDPATGAEQAEGIEQGAGSETSPAATVAPSESAAKTAQSQTDTYKTDMSQTGMSQTDLSKTEQKDAAADSSAPAPAPAQAQHP